MGFITLYRAYLPDDSATLGKLILPGGWSCYTLEPPWKNNERGISCIPEGVYPVRRRQSPVVERASAGVFEIGWEICDVPERDFIMFHPGNWVKKDTEGCPLVGRDFAWDPQHGPMVTRSRITFARFMEEMTAREEWQIKISTQDGGR